jgi:hypothetical protein
MRVRGVGLEVGERHGSLTSGLVDDRDRRIEHALVLPDLLDQARGRVRCLHLAPRGAISSTGFSGFHVGCAAAPAIHGDSAAKSATAP